MMRRRTLLASAVWLGCSATEKLATLREGAVAVAVAGERVFALTGFGKSHLWRIDDEPVMVADRLSGARALAVHDGFLWVATEEGVARVAVDGAVPRRDFPAEDVRALTRFGGRMVIGTEAGTIRALDGSVAVDLGSSVASLAASAEALFAVADGRLFRVHHEATPMPEYGGRLREVVVVGGAPVAASPDGLVREGGLWIEGDAPAALVARGGWLAWAEPGRVRRRHPDGTRSEKRASAQALALADSGALIWVDVETRRILKDKHLT